MPPSTTKPSPLTQPPAVDVVLQFVNTHTSGPRQLKERFSNAQAMQAWLHENGLGTSETHVTEADAAGARELRDALITVLLAHAGDKDITPEVLTETEEYLRGIAARYPLVTVVTASGASLTTAQTGVPGLFGTVLAASPNSPRPACGTGCGRAGTSRAISASSTGRGTALPPTAGRGAAPRRPCGPTGSGRRNWLRTPTRRDRYGARLPLTGCGAQAMPDGPQVARAREVASVPGPRTGWRSRPVHVACNPPTTSTPYRRAADASTPVRRPPLLSPVDLSCIA